LDNAAVGRGGAVYNFDGRVTIEDSDGTGIVRTVTVTARADSGRRGATTAATTIGA
jgi:hypothetical protein